ncbi:hypothetical protein ACFV3I_03935 [Microbacterium sp. NPDC059771]|uniref:hypothetical protein n=1 Tax=Microbacterium sp. NPDC059771 TaxID=3346941 RepID=UPI003650B8C7
MERARLHWWILALAAAGALLGLFSPWAFLIEGGLLILVIHRLTRRPPRSEAAVLIAAGVILALVLVTFAAIGIATYFYEGVSHGTSVPIR